MKIFGIVPAAGMGTRLAPLPFSKELFPLGYQMISGKYRPRPVSLHLVEAFQKAEIRHLFWVTSETKDDIRKYYKNGSAYAMNFCYLIQNEPAGMVDAINCVNPWLTGHDDYLVAVGMPDTLFYPNDIFAAVKQLLLADPKIDVALGLFETEQWHKLGMVSFDKGKNHFMVNKIWDKPKVFPGTRLAWGVAMWRPTFQKLLSTLPLDTKSTQEYTLSDAFNHALENGLSIAGIQGSSFIDIGTIEDLQKAIELTNAFPLENHDDV